MGKETEDAKEGGAENSVSWRSLETHKNVVLIVEMYLEVKLEM